MRRHSGSSPANMDGYQSDISLTSSAEDNDSNQEWEVDDVIAVDDEYRGENGNVETRFLVRWTGYQLGDATWEPEDHLGSELLEQWQERKARQARGEEPEFEVQAWLDDRKALDQAKLERHRRRNAKRRKLGLELTEPIEDEEDDFDPVLDAPQESESSDEAVEEDTIIDKVNEVLPSSTPTTVIKPLRRPGIFKGLPPQASVRPKKETPREETRRSGSTSRPATAVHDSATRPAHPQPQPQPQPQLSRPQNRLPSATGYQGTARKSSSTNTTGAPTASLQSSSSLAAKFGGGKKILTAKRSVKPAPGVGNVFTSGTIRKRRQKLGEAMVDPSKEPKAFQRQRIVRKAELQSRSKADAAVPDISLLKKVLFDPSQGPPPKRSSRDVQTPASGSESRTSTLATSISDIAQGSAGSFMQIDGPVTGQETSTLNEKGPPRKKPRKSVRFFEDDDPRLVDEPMQIDSVTSPSTQDAMSPMETEGLAGNSMPDPSQFAVPQRYSPSSEESNRPTRPSISTHRATANQTLERTLVLVARKTTNIRVAFNGLPGASNLPWLSEFQCQENIVIGHECFARSFNRQINFLTLQVICSGFITSDDPITEQIAEHLRVSLSGLFYSRPDYSLVIYPTKCEDWKMGNLDSDPCSPAGMALKYAFFSSQPDLNLVLRPIPQSPMDYSQCEEIAECKARDMLFRHVFGPGYRNVVQQGSSSGEQASTVPDSQYAIYLAFPQAKRDLCSSICAWMREVKPECKIYTTYDQGAWISFLNMSQGSKGIILVHEALVWTIRHFPSLFNVLRNTDTTVWCFSEPLPAHPLYPSQLLEPTIPGTMSFTPLFPQGHAILITPSFMVSQPEDTKAIFHWYIKYKMYKPTYKLVTAWNIQQYLHDLRLDKAKRSANLRDGQEKQEMKKEDSVRFETAAIVNDKLAINEESAWTYSTYGEDGPLVYADECIDANDEQSLVNWFGWWSTLRLDQYRYFYVIGSTAHIINSTPTKGSRRLSIPRYASSSKSNPDTTHKNSMPEETGANSRNTVAPDQPVSGTEIHSEILNHNDDAGVFRRHLESIDKKMAKIRLYWFPVSWSDLSMADHFGDHTTSFARISDWFNFTTPWQQSPFGTTSSYRTYVGFFYTIVDNWNPALFPQRQKPRRHPWIVIYRPVNPHLTRTPWFKSELIIWDTEARKNFGSHKEIHEGDLPYMQRQVIQYIREHGPEKNPGTPLDRVFLGSFAEPETDIKSPIDVTLEFLEALMVHVENTMAATDSHLLENGYRKIILEGGQSTSLNHISNQSEPMDVDQTDDSSDDEQRRVIVFHPPKSTQSPSLGKSTSSNCQNDLYESARLARLRNKKATTMVYAYKPTAEWYEQQRSEGRGFEHIHVGDSDSVFKILRIEKAPKLAGN